jgi:hypothetical protein
VASAWIKVEHVTPDKPEVDAIAQALGIDPDAVVGKLLRFWIWADQQSISGNGISVTKKLLDRITYQPGFADAMLSVGWITDEGGIFSIPNFDRHNGESAKSRSNTQKRAQRFRDARNAPTVTTALPEKRREEKKEIQNTPLPPEGGVSPWAIFKGPIAEHFGEATSHAVEQKQFRLVGELAKLGATPEQLADRVSRYRQFWPDVACTLQAVVNNWNQIPTQGKSNGTHFKSRGEKLDAGAEQLLRDLGGTGQGDRDPAAPHGSFSGPRTTLPRPAFPAGG